MTQLTKQTEFVDRDYIEVNLDLHDKSSTSQVEKCYTLMQNNHNSRVLRCILTKGCGLVPVDLSNSALTLYIKKADLALVMLSGQVIDAKNGIVDFLLTRQALTIADKITCEVVKTGIDKSTMSFPNFTLEIDKTIVDEDLVESTNDFSALNDTLAKVIEWDGKFTVMYNDLDKKVDGEIAKTNAQLSSDKKELSKKIQEVASTGTTTEVVQKATETFIQKKIDDGTIANMTIEDGTITSRKTTFVVPGLNLFNKDDFKRGDIGPFNGIFSSNPSSNNMASGFIKVKRGDILYFRDVTKNPSNVMGRMFKYDESKNFIAYYTPDYNSFKYEIDFDGYLRFHINVNTFNDESAKISISLNEDVNAETYRPYEEHLDAKINVRKAEECNFAIESETAKSCEIANQAVNAQKAVESETSNHSKHSDSADSAKLLEKTRVVNLFDVNNATRTGPSHEKQENGAYLFRNINSTPIFWFIKNIQPLFEVGEKWYAIIHGKVISGDHSNIQVNIQRMDSSRADYITLSDDGTFKGYISGSIASNTNTNLFGGFRVKEIPTDGSCTIELYNFCYLSSKVELNEKQIEYFYDNQLNFKEKKAITYEATDLIKEVVAELIPPYFNDYTTKTDVNQMINNKLSEKNSWYAGKKLSIFGDSITECSGSFTLDNGVEGSEWSILLNKHFGFGEVVNCGLGGSTVVDLAPSCMANDKRINAIPQDSDVITFMGGTNDWLQNQPIGTLEGNDGYYNGLKTVAEKLIKRFPTAKIFWMTPTYGLIGDGTGQNYTEISSTAKINLYEYVKAMRETSKRYGFPLIDLYGECGWNKFNAKIYLNSEKNLLHPNKNGGKRISSVIIGEFEKHEPIE